MKSDATPNLTGLLVAWGEGDQGALAALAPIVQQELHRVAARQMTGERPGHILQPTALGAGQAGKPAPCEKRRAR